MARQLAALLETPIYRIKREIDVLFDNLTDLGQYETDEQNNLEGVVG